MKDELQRVGKHDSEIERTFGEIPQEFRTFTHIKWIPKPGGIHLNIKAGNHISVDIIFDGTIEGITRYTASNKSCG